MVRAVRRHIVALKYGIVAMMLLLGMGAAHGAPRVAIDLKFVKSCDFGGLDEANHTLDALKITDTARNTCEEKALAAFGQGYQPYQLAYVGSIVQKADSCGKIAKGSELPSAAADLFERQWAQKSLGRVAVKEVKARDIAALCLR
jgi:hypothetical protein